MSSFDLQTIQDPIKARYRDEPAAALVTLSAEGNLGEGITCSVQTGRALVNAGLHPGAGGDGLAVCSGDMLLQALVACAGVTLNAVSIHLGTPLRNARVRAEGDVDLRGTLGVGQDAPVGFREIRLYFDVDSDADQATLQFLLEMTERHCVVYQSLAGTPALRSSISAAPINPLA